MKLLSTKSLVFTAVLGLLLITSSYAQQGTVTVNQDERINTLLELKKEINKSEKTSDRYKIQIYSGNRSSAQNAQTEFRNKIGKWQSKLLYETPNFKVWVGSFTTRLEADRALQRIKQKFPNAFIFKPKKEKK